MTPVQIRHLVTFGIASTFAIGIFGCDQPVESEVRPLEIVEDSVSVEFSKSRRLALSDTGTRAITRVVGWSSSDTMIVRVTSSGLVTGFGVGRAVIVASDKYGSDSSVVAVLPASRSGDLKSVSAGGRHACALDAIGGAYCWGENARGELGDGTTETRDGPVKVTNLSPVLSISVGSYGSCAIETSGRALCWGSNHFGQLGDGTGIDTRGTPTLVAGGLVFSSLSMGTHHTCGVVADGRAYCWGRNDSGQLGTVTPVCRNSRSGSVTYCSFAPIPVDGGLRFSSVSAGVDHTCGVSTDGAIYCWGKGDLGNASTDSSPVPLRVAGSVRFRAVTVGAQTCGLATEGSLYCWGSTYPTGGPPVRQPTPVLVPANDAFSAVDAGGRHICATTVAGSVQCWLNNLYGALGNGSTVDRPQPTDISSDVVFRSISAGSDFSCGVSISGIAYCWGVNDHGQIGTTRTETTCRRFDSSISCSMVPLLVRMPGQVPNSSTDDRIGSRMIAIRSEDG